MPIDEHANNLLDGCRIPIVFDAFRSSESFSEGHLPNPKHATPSNVGGDAGALEVEPFPIGEPQDGAVNNSGFLVGLELMSEDGDPAALVVVEPQIDGMGDVEILLLPA
jgi:hypothetical protein